MSKRHSGARVRKNKGPWKNSAQKIRREVAEARNILYTKLSTLDKLKKLDDGNFVATKQRQKLLAKLEQETKQ